MIILDRLLKERAAQGRPIRVGLIGAGFMARGITNQCANSVPGMVVAAIANRTVVKAEEAYAEAGVKGVRRLYALAQIEDAIEKGYPVVTDDAFSLCEAANIDCIIDATGHPEFGAQVTMRAISCGKHIVSMNAELDGTVGTMLQRYGDAAGVVVTGCDGDQPGVQMNLYRFVKSIGLTPLVCGNIKGLQDRYRTPATQASFAAKWGQNPQMVTSFADGTKINFEQAMVANATGMTVERRGMRGSDHAGHVDELTSVYDVDELRNLGGVVDYVVGAKPSPGVFVLATHDDPKQRHYLNLYKLGEGPLYSFYVPYHLCHFEVPLSVARVVLAGDAVIRPVGPPQLDVVTLAKTALKAGDMIDGIGGFMTYGECERYETARAGRLLPIGVAEGCRIKRDISRDTALTYEDVELPAGRLIDRLRAEQESIFPTQSSQSDKGLELAPA